MEKVGSGFIKADHTVTKILKIFAGVSACALIAIMLVAFVNVCCEKLASAGVEWIEGIPNSNAIIQYLHIPLVFLAAGWVTLDQGQTRIDLIIGKFPKVEKISMVIGHICGAAISFFIAYRGAVSILVKDLSKNIRIATTADSWKEWPFTVLYIIGFAVLGFSFIWAIVRMVKFWDTPGVNPRKYIYPAPKGEDDHEPFSGDEAETEGGEEQ